MRSLSLAPRRAAIGLASLLLVGGVAEETAAASSGSPVARTRGAMAVSPRASTVATTTWGVPRMADSWASPAAAETGAAMGAVVATTTEPGTVASTEPVAGNGVSARPARFTPGKGIGAESADGRWAIQASLRAGLLATVVHSQAPGEATAVGMELRRLRALFTGHAFGEHNRYFFHLGFAPRDLGYDGEKARYTPVLDAYVDFTYLRDLTLRVGQYRPQYNRERLILDINPLLVDRSLANGEFNFDRDVGFDLRSDDLFGLGLMRYYAGIFRGRGRDPRGVGDTGLLYTGRLELTPLGRFDDYESADLRRERRLRLAFGGAYAFHDRARRDRGVLGEAPADGGTTNFHSATVDLMAKYAGWYLEAGMLWRQGRRSPGGAVDAMGAVIPAAAPRNGYGWFVQTSMLIPGTRLEPALRYATVRPLASPGSPSSLTPRSELGGGLNFYVHGHDLKVQLDYFRLWEGQAIAAGTDQVRAQVQIAF